ADEIGGGVDIRRRELGRSTWRHDNGVLPRRVDQDRGSAGGLRLALRNEARIDALGAVDLARQLTEVVAPELGDEADLATEPRSGDRLVRALAAGAHAEALTQHGLAPDRQARRQEGEVGDEDAQDGDGLCRGPCRWCHGWPPPGIWTPFFSSR